MSKRYRHHWLASKTIRFSMFEKFTCYYVTFKYDSIVSYCFKNMLYQLRFKTRIKTSSSCISLLKNFRQYFNPIVIIFSLTF